MSSSRLSFPLLTFLFSTLLNACATGGNVAPPSSVADQSELRRPDFTNPGPCSQLHSASGYVAPNVQCNPTPPPPPPGIPQPSANPGVVQPPNCYGFKKGSYNGQAIALNFTLVPPSIATFGHSKINWVSWTASPYPPKSLQYGYDVSYTSTANISAANPTGQVYSYSIIASLYGNQADTFSNQVPWPSAGTTWDGYIATVYVYINNYGTLIKTFQETASGC